LYLALYRRFRPETFERVLGQEHIVKILTNQLRNETVGHAYLFCGTRGTGKTTMARLLAKGVNCLSDGERPCGLCANCLAVKDGVFMDVIEIDAASNNGVENIRELRESVKYPPSVGRRKVYIVDEVHMLSSGAFNALLKTLEEPPEHVMFILATTERQKLPATVLSRCLRLDFKRVPAETVKKGMRSVCAELGVGVTEEALALLASNADGSVRDALSLLDQCVCASADEVTRDTVLELLGSPGEDQLILLTDMIYDGNVSDALFHLDRMLAEGRDERQLIKDWIEHFRRLLLLRHLKRPDDILNMSAENIDALREQCERLTPAFVNDGIFALAETLNDAAWSAQPRVLLEVGIIKMASLRDSYDAVASMPDPVGRAPTAKSAPPKPAPAKPAAPEKSAPEKPKQEQPSFAADKQDAALSRPAPSEPALAPAIDWQAVIAEVKNEKSVLMRLDGHSRLVEVGKGSFIIEVFDKFTKMTAEDGKDRIEAAVARMAGMPLHMDCRLNESAAKDREPARAVRETAPEPPEPEEVIQVQETLDLG
jgi:DNA polymerase-3 subunit gamma/tau